MSAKDLITFLNMGDGPRVNVAELKEFKASCTQEEWEQFQREAAEILNTPKE